MKATTPAVLFWLCEATPRLNRGGSQGGFEKCRHSKGFFKNRCDIVMTDFFHTNLSELSIFRAIFRVPSGKLT